MKITPALLDSLESVLKRAQEDWDTLLQQRPWAARLRQSRRISQFLQWNTRNNIQRIAPHNRRLYSH